MHDTTALEQRLELTRHHLVRRALDVVWQASYYSPNAFSLTGGWKTVFKKKKIHPRADKAFVFATLEV